jgi:D-alanyl-D-alanine carboxypeptidase/D-alanyl-D-alanine-endopeptidase (penicillin-binding protein 4)
LPNQSFSYQIHQKKPHLIAAGTLKNKLRENSITTDGNIDECYLFNNGSISKLNTIAQFDRELPELIAVANKHSDNYVAETIFKLIGAYNGNHKNNSSKSRYVIKGLLNSIGIDTNNFQINDGSGLSRRNKITAESLIKILISLFYHKDFSKFDSTLSISGVDGTLRKRLIGTKAEGNLRAKTGTLRNVSALAGYVNTLDDEKLAFAFIFNGPNPPAYKSIEDEIGKLLAQFFYYHFEN